MAHFAFPMLSLLNERGKVPHPVRKRPLYDPHSNDSVAQRHDHKVEEASKLTASHDLAYLAKKNVNSMISVY